MADNQTHQTLPYKAVYDMIGGKKNNELLFMTPQVMTSSVKRLNGGRWENIRFYHWTASNGWQLDPSITVSTRTTKVTHIDAAPSLVNLSQIAGALGIEATRGLLNDTQRSELTSAIMYALQSLGMPEAAINPPSQTVQPGLGAQQAHNPQQNVVQNAPERQKEAVTPERKGIFGR